MLGEIDLVLVMTVNPGFGGQSFIAAQLGKIRRLKAMIEASGRDIPIEVDGGVTAETAPLCREAGARVLVAGTAIFHAADYAQAIAAVRGE
jgi:ribulose-phosphate 3-epimerase